MPNGIVSSSLAARAREIVEALGGHWANGKGMCCCPAHDDRTPSLAIGLSPNAILFHCFAGCSSDAVLAGLARHGVRPRDLFDGSGRPLSSPVTRMQVRAPRANALRLWREAVPLAGTPAERYLAARHVSLRSPELRYHPRMPLGSKANARFLPALVAAVRDDEGLLSLQRTFLDPGRAAKAAFSRPKRGLGSPGTGAVRLFAPEAGRLGLAEGVENALSATQLFAIPAWATLGNERFGQVTIPDSVRELHLFLDADAGGALAGQRAREAYARHGRMIIAHRPERARDDWNAVLMRQEGREALGR